MNAGNAPLPSNVYQWRIEYADDELCYYVIDPSGERVQKSLPIRKAASWKILRFDKGYAAVDETGGEIESDVLKEYQIVELINFGGSSLCYKAVCRSTGRVVIIKELYPYSLAKKKLIYRSGIHIMASPGLDLQTQNKVKNIFERGFAQEQDANDGIRFYLDANMGLTNDPRFLTSAVAPFLGSSEALNKYEVIDTQAGVFLDQVQFNSEGREQVIDKLSVIKQLLVAVRVLHREKKRIHLDLKPENLLISKVHINDEKFWGNHPVIIIDFGSSWPVDDEGSLLIDNRKSLNLTSTGDYAAPEVYNAALDGDYSGIGVISDIYSCFVILQQILLSDSDNFNNRSNELFCSRSISSLSKYEQNMLNELLMKGLESREIDTAEKMIKELNTAIDVLKNLGIHPVIIRKNAERIKEKIKEGKTIDNDMLCEVEIMKSK